MRCCAIPFQGLVMKSDLLHAFAVGLAIASLFAWTILRAFASGASGPTGVAWLVAWLPPTFASVCSGRTYFAQYIASLRLYILGAALRIA